MHYDRRQRKPSLLASCGGLLAGASVGLAAYASHGVSDAVAQSRLETAALFAFGHGVALAALTAGTTRRMGRLALSLLLLGTLLFSGSLVAAVFAGVPTALAPVGGVVMMLGWLSWSLDAARR